MNCDRALISKCVQTGGIASVISRGVAPHHFLNSPDGQECAQVLEWLSSHAKKYGVAPSMQLFRERWSSFQFEPSSDPLDALTDSFFAHVKRRAFSAKVVELAHLEADPSRWQELDVLMLDAARDLAALVPSGRVSRFSDMDKRIATYEDEAANPDQQKRIKMGIKPFDDSTNGMRPGNLVTIAGFSGLGKALDLDVPVPTPSGWTTMGNLKPGDYVYAPDGTPTRVSYAFPVLLGSQCFEVCFSDGSSIIADADHQWLLHRSNARSSESRALARVGERVAPWNDQQHKRVRPELVTTTMMKTITETDRLRPSLPCSEPVWKSEKDLPIDPYIFGYWLGDGTSLFAEITVAIDDSAHLENELEVAGLQYRRRRRVRNTYRIRFGGIDTCCRGHSKAAYNQNAAGCKTCQKQRLACRVSHEDFDTRYPKTCFASQTWLTKLGVKDNKHIPSAYLEGSIDQRLSLLQGIVDSDGYAMPSGGVQIAVTNRRLATDVFALVSSLGIKANWSEKVARLYGRDCGTAYQITFTTSLDVARLPRKLRKLKKPRQAMYRHRFVVAVNEVASRPVRCIMVDHESHEFLVSRAYIPTHNSMLSQLVILNGYEQDATGLIMTLEMTSEEIFERLDTMVTNFSHQLLARRELSDESIDLWRRISNQFTAAKNDIVVVDRAMGATTDRVYAEINRYKPDICVVDYVQLMRSRQNYASQWQSLVDITNDLKQIALATDCVIVMVSQDGRGAAEHGSTETNMGGSISVYQAADIYLGLHQTDEMYHEDKMEVRLLKARGGRKKLSATLHWEPATMKFEYVDAEEASDAQQFRRQLQAV